MIKEGDLVLYAVPPNKPAIRARVKFVHAKTEEAELVGWGRIFPLKFLTKI